MQATLLEKEAIHAKFSVEIPADDVSQAYKTILREIARQVKIPGFRPGKAPRNIIEARVGKDAIQDEVRSALVEQFYPRAIKQLELNPIQINIDKVDPIEGEAYVFEVNAELYPEVALPDVQEIVIDTEVPTVSDDMVADAVSQIQDENAILNPVERPVEAGDYLLLKLASSPDSNPMPLDLNSADEALATQLLGKTLNEEVEITITLPGIDDALDDVADEDSDPAGDEATNEAALAEADASEIDAGEDAIAVTRSGSPDDTATDNTDTEVDTEVDTPTPPETLQIIVADIKEKELPDADDDLAATLGYETWQEVETQIRSNIQAELTRDARGEQREELIDKLVENSTFELPESLISQEKASLLRNLERDLEQRGLTLKGYFDYLETEEEDGGKEEFEQDLNDKAKQSAAREVVLGKLMEERIVRLSEAEFKSSLELMARYQDTTLPKLRRDLGENGLRNYRYMLERDNTLNAVLNELLGENEDAQDAATEDSQEDNLPADDAQDANAEVVAEAETPS
ncbi:MAG: trigger factor [Deinococcota bacterium]